MIAKSKQSDNEVIAKSRKRCTCRFGQVSEIRSQAWVGLGKAWARRGKVPDLGPRGHLVRGFFFKGCAKRRGRLFLFSTVWQKILYEPCATGAILRRCACTSLFGFVLDGFFLDDSPNFACEWGSYLFSIELPLDIRICCRGLLA